MTSLIFHLFVVILSRITKWGDCQDILGTYQNICHVELANPLTKRILLVIGQLQDVFNTSSNKSSSLVLNPCKSVQETSEEVLFIKARQLARHFSQVGVLVTYWDPCIDQLVTYLEPCIERRDYHYIANPIVYWGKGSTVGWYQVLRFILLVTACFDNSGFSRMVTLNSPGGVLSRWFSPFVNKSSMSNLFSAAFNLVGGLFVLPRLLHVIESN